MDTIELGRTGVQVSALSLGCMGMGTVAESEASMALLDRYADDGGSFLDTADCYAWWQERGTSGGQSEEVVGRWLARSGRRDDVFLATKGSALLANPEEVWPDDVAHPDVSRARFVGAGAAALRSSLEGSLRRLDVDYVDLYYVHVDDRTTRLEETLQALANFVSEGKVRYLGWSNVRTWRVERIRGLCEQNGWPQPVALQQQHSYLQPRPGLDKPGLTGCEQLDYLRERDDLSLIAYSPVLKGLYDAPAARRFDHPEMARAYESDAALRRLAALDDVAAELGVKPGQVALAWLAAQRSPRIIPLFGSTRPERYAAAVAALELSLSPDHLAVLDAA
ncbi:aldo/keto reductase [Geodermatophilus sp. SYSU D00700]